MINQLCAILNLLKTCCIVICLLTINTCTAQKQSVSIVVNNEVYPSYLTDLNKKNINSSFVTSGRNIGLEIKSGKDIYLNRLKNLIANESAQKKLNRFYTANTSTKNPGDWEITSLLPEIIGNTDSAVISTPSELLNVTNAVEMLAVHYKKNDATKCVAFLTKTLGEKYAHSKLMSDRYRGAQILGFKMFDIAGYNLVAYKLMQPNGQTESGLEFSVGLNHNSNNCNLENNLLVNNQQSKDLFYNLQLWANDDEMLIELATNILNKIQKITTVNFVKTTSPAIYITKAKLVDSQLIIELINNTSDSLLQIQIRNCNNVLSNQIYTKVKPNERNILYIPISKDFTGNITLLQNTKAVDSYYF